MNNNWQTQEFGKIAKFSIGRTPSRSQNIYWKEGKYPWVSISDMVPFGVITNTRESVSEDAHSKVFKQRLSPAGTLLMSFKLTIGRTSLLGVDSYHNEAIVSIYPSTEIDKEYLFYYLPTINYLNYQDTAVKGKTLNKDKINRLLINYPKIDDQKIIVNYLNLINTRISTQKKLININLNFKFALMTHLFTKGTKDEKTKLTDIGEMPESWNVAELKSLVPDIEYGVSQAIPKNRPEHGYKIVSTADITKAGGFLYEQLRYIDVKNSQAEKLRLKNGDVLFNWRNSLDHIGKTTIYEDHNEHVIFASFILRLRCDEKKAHNRFISNLMNYYREKEVFSKLARRAVNQANYNRNEIYVLQVPSPSYEEQVEIANVIEKIDKKIKLAQKKLTLYQQLFNTLLHELMSGNLNTNKYVGVK